MLIRDGATAFRHDGGQQAVLVVHDIGDSPASVRPWATLLAESDVTVRAPRLPGHGTTAADLVRPSWEQWYAELESTLAEALESVPSVVVVGVGHGACPALMLAERHRTVGGVGVLDPVLPAPPRASLAEAVRSKATRLTHTARHTRGLPRAVRREVQEVGRHALRDLPQITQPAVALVRRDASAIQRSSAEVFVHRVSTAQPQLRTVDGTPGEIAEAVHALTQEAADELA